MSLVCSAMPNRLSFSLRDTLPFGALYVEVSDIVIVKELT
jgi:hypothetical protein